MKNNSMIQQQDGVYRAVVCYTKDGVPLWARTGEWTTDLEQARRDVEAIKL